MVHSDLSEECGRRLSGDLFTKITLNKTILYNVQLFASRCFFIIANVRFLNTSLYFQTFKDMTNCLSEFVLSAL